jgi:hypothetical protein
MRNKLLRSNYGIIILLIILILLQIPMVIAWIKIIDVMNFIKALFNLP